MKHLDGAGYLLLKEPEELFTSPSPTEVKEQYRALAKLWHPDVNKHPDAVTVFAHINKLYDAALDKIKKGTWEVPGVFDNNLRNGNPFTFNFKKKFKFELGQTYLGQDHVTYIVDAREEHFVRNYERVTADFKFGSTRMREEAERYLPKPKYSKLKDGRHVLQVPHTTDLIRLRDVLEFYNNDLDVKHVAWICSSLYNLSCYLNFTGVVHADISLDTYFISPKYHSGSLLGGWWYAARQDHILSVVSRRTYDLLPHEVKVKKVATPRIDLELVKEVGRELVGPKMFDIPDPLRDWLKAPAGDKPIAEYAAWQDVLKQSFGARKYTEMKLDAAEVYA